jgi:hypothetical protein
LTGDEKTEGSEPNDSKHYQNSISSFYSSLVVQMVKTVEVVAALFLRKLSRLLAALPRQHKLQQLPQ